MLSEELPLFRTKLPGLYAGQSTGPGVGPGSYDISFDYPQPTHGIAPFGSTSDRFALLALSRLTPGAGTYDPRKDIYPTGDVSIVPFVSNSDRFYYGKVDEVPGPGQYSSDGNNWRKTGKCHKFSNNDPRFTADSIGNGPGTYSPNFAAAHRSYPKAAHFGKYSGRGDPRIEISPGPGQYDVKNGRSIYAGKPTSMFVSKTLRSSVGDKSKAPGPGTYNIPSSFQSLENHQQFNPESFSAFGSSAPRYKDFLSKTPGPGTYAGNIAPRRPKVWSTKGTAPFLSELSRFDDTKGTSVGPGVYADGSIPKLNRYKLASVPFRSTVSRFPETKPDDVELSYETRHPVVRVPKRIHPARFQSPFFDRSKGPKSPLHGATDRVYDVKRDWPKPECTSGAHFGLSPRFRREDPNKSTLGPGYYDVSNPLSSTKGSWGTDGRFIRGHNEGTPGPAQYWYDSTFNKRTFNRTIGNWAEI